MGYGYEFEICGIIFSCVILDGLFSFWVLIVWCDNGNNNVYF